MILLKTGTAIFQMEFMKIDDDDLPTLVSHLEDGQGNQLFLLIPLQKF